MQIVVKVTLEIHTSDTLCISGKPGRQHLYIVVLVGEMKSNPTVREAVFKCFQMTEIWSGPGGEGFSLSKLMENVHSSTCMVRKWFFKRSGTITKN